MDLMDQMDQMDNVGEPLYTPWVCCAAVWFGSGVNVPVGLINVSGAPIISKLS